MTKSITARFMYKYFSVALLATIGVASAQNSAFAQSSINNVNLPECRRELDAYVTATRRFTESVQPTGDAFYPMPSVSSAVGSTSGIGAVTRCVQSYERSIPNNPSLCPDASAFMRAVAAAGTSLPGQGGTVNQLVQIGSAEPRIRRLCETANSRPTPVPPRLTTYVPPHNEARPTNDRGIESQGSQPEFISPQAGAEGTFSSEECTLALNQYEQAGGNASANSRIAVTGCTRQYAERIIEDPSVCPQALSYARRSEGAASDRVLIRSRCRSSIVSNIPAERRRNISETVETTAIDSPDNQYPPGRW